MLLYKDLALLSVTMNNIDHQGKISTVRNDNGLILILGLCAPITETFVLICNVV